MRKFFYNAKDDIHWNIPSRRRLFKRLGDYDTMAEFTVLAVRHFESLCKQADSYVDFVNTKAVEFDVKIRCGVTLENYREALYKSFMVNSHAMFNDFLNNFKEDIKLFINHDFSLVSNQQLSTYKKVLVGLKTIGIAPIIPEWLEDIIEYYRIIRNHVAHNKDNDEDCQKAYDRIDIEQMNIDYPVFQGKAPNPPDSITMDDFYLYSASIKHIANLLTISLQGRERWEVLGNYHPKFRKEHIASGTDKRKLVNTVLNGYGLKCNKEDVDTILSVIRTQYQ